MKCAWIKKFFFLSIFSLLRFCRWQIEWKPNAIGFNIDLACASLSSDFKLKQAIAAAAANRKEGQMTKHKHIDFLLEKENKN